MNKDKFNAIAGLVGLGVLAMTLAIRDWQISDLNARVRRLEAQLEAQKNLKKED